jgi:hypothetical protein
LPSIRHLLRVPAALLGELALDLGQDLAVVFYCSRALGQQNLVLLLDLGWGRKLPRRRDIRSGSWPAVSSRWEGSTPYFKLGSSRCFPAGGAGRWQGRSALSSVF